MVAGAGASHVPRWSTAASSPLLYGDHPEARIPGLVHFPGTLDGPCLPAGSISPPRRQDRSEASRRMSLATDARIGPEAGTNGLPGEQANAGLMYAQGRLAARRGLPGRSGKRAASARTAGLQRRCGAASGTMPLHPRPGPAISGPMRMPRHSWIGAACGNA